MRGRWWYWRRRLRRRARSGNEGLRTGRLASLGGVGVLQQGADLGEGGAWAHHGNEGRLLVEVIAETGDEDVDELPIGHGIAEFTKLVGDSTKVLAVGADGGVALDGVAELVVEAGDAAVNVVSWKSCRRADQRAEAVAALRKTRLKISVETRV
jgi:hypothetical protein